MRALRSLVCLAGLVPAVTATAQTGRSMQLLAPPAIGVDCQVSVSFPSAAAGNLFAILWSGAYSGAVPLTIPGFAVSGLMRLDPLQFEIGPIGAFDASGIAAVTLPVPNDTGLLGLALDLQSVDLNFAAATIAFADNDLPLTIAGLLRDWEVIFGHSVGGHDTFRRVVADATGVYVTGNSLGFRPNDPFNPYSYEILTQRYSVTGALQWQHRYDSPGLGFDDVGVDLALAANGDLVVLGQGPGATSDQDIVLLRLDAQGAQQWVTRWNFSVSDGAVDLAIAADGSIYVLGAGAGVGIGLLKFSAAGVLQWQRLIHGGFGTDIGVGIAFDSHGNIDIGGYSVGPNVSTNFDWVAFEYDPSGNQLWNQRLVGSPTLPDYCWGMTVDLFDRVLLTGSMATSGYTLAAFADGGTPLWTTGLGVPGGAPYSMVCGDAAGNLYCASNSSVVGIDPAGAVFWQRTVLGQARAIAVDNLGHVFVTSAAIINGFNTQFLLSAFAADGSNLGTQVGGSTLVDEYAPNGLTVFGGAIYAVGAHQNPARNTDGYLARIRLLP